MEKEGQKGTLQNKKKNVENSASLPPVVSKCSPQVLLLSAPNDYFCKSINNEGIVVDLFFSCTLCDK